MERIRRRVANDIGAGGRAPPDWDNDHPWTSIFILASGTSQEERSYWD